MENSFKVSIVVPVYNEGETAKHTLLALATFLSRNNFSDYEIIVINDGSDDSSGEYLHQLDINNLQIIDQPYNKGYGAALKRGVALSRSEWVLFCDSDGQHQPEDVLRLIKEINNCDMVIGSRSKYQGPAWRQPGKKVINLIANYLVRFKIPDLNSGLRVAKRECFQKFSHLYPDGFSLSTTMTLAFIKQGLSVKFVPVVVKERRGKSSVKIRDGFKTINLVIRMIMLFSPLRVFLPLGGLIFFVGLVSFIFDLTTVNLTDTTVFLILSSIIFISFGFLADQVAAMRRDMKSLTSSH